MSDSLKRPMSSRERPASGRSNRPSSRPGSARVAMGRPSSASPFSARTAARVTRLNEPLEVNKVYLRDTSKLTPRIGSTMLPPSRYPTRYVDKDKDIVRRRKPPICPQSWIDSHSGERPDLSKADSEMRRTLSETFVDANAGRIEEYSYEFRGKSPRTIKEMIINSSQFGRVMGGLEHKQRSVGKGTSSFQLKSCLFEDHLEPVKKISSYDPNILSYNTSRAARDAKRKQLFASDSKLNGRDTTHVRGYRHIPEYGNFSSFSGHLVKNQGAILNR